MKRSHYKGLRTYLSVAAGRSLQQDIGNAGVESLTSNGEDHRYSFEVLLRDKTLADG